MLSINSFNFSNLTSLPMSEIPTSCLALSLMFDCNLNQFSANTVAEWLQRTHPSTVYNHHVISDMFNSYTTEGFLNLYEEFCGGALEETASNEEIISFLINHLAENFGFPVLHSTTNEGDDIWTIVEEVSL